MSGRPAARRASRARWLLLAVAGCCLAASFLSSAGAHPVSERNAGFVQEVQGAAPAPFMYLGAKHMFTGYDHLLFLAGVIFFLAGLKDVVLYVSLFTLGHSLTLLIGVLAGVKVNPFVIDAVIGLSVVYKGFENIGGLRHLSPVRIDTRAAVFGFGLIHGLGLATRLQDYTVRKEGLVANILSFNLGVEIGQMMALVILLIVLGWWRTRASFDRYAFAANTVLMIGGFLLAGNQLFGYVTYS